MKFFKNKYLSISLTSFVIFIITAFFILSASIPDNVFVSRSDSDGGWIPHGWRWIVSARETPSAPAMENTAKKVSSDSSDLHSNATVYLCGVIPVKTVNLSITDSITVIPGGESIGIKLKTEGLLVVGTDSFTASDSSQICPAKQAGIKKGDTIEKMNGITVDKISQVQEIIKNADDAIICEGKRNTDSMTWTLNPCEENQSGEKRAGLWLRESVAGVGTLTFYHENSFAALGHPIADADTGAEVEESGGSVCPAAIIGINKGEKGIPGALKGVFAGEDIGEIRSNSASGIYGEVYSPPTGESVPLAGRKEVRTGKARIICDTGGGKKYYDIEILKVMPASYDTKSMVIHITDKELIEKTGGIVQGMSGSPIVQNGKLIGAVTHVFVNDPTRGYGIFIENMLAEAEKIK